MIRVRTGRELIDTMRAGFSVCVGEIRGECVVPFEIGRCNMMRDGQIGYALIYSENPSLYNEDGVVNMAKLAEMATTPDVNNMPNIRVIDDMGDLLSAFMEFIKEHNYILYTDISNRAATLRNIMG